MKLGGYQIKQLREALQSAFPSKAALKRVVRENLDKNLDELGEGNLTDLISDLLAWAESNNRIKELIVCSAYENHKNQYIQNFYEANIDNLIEFDDSLFSNIMFRGLFSILKEIDFPVLWKVGKTMMLQTIGRDRLQSIQSLEQSELSYWFKNFILLQLLVEDFPLFEQQPSIFIFIDQLSKETMLDNTVQQILIEWLDKVNYNSNGIASKLATSSSVYSQPVEGELQAYLMIVVNPEKAKLRATASLVCISPTGMKKEIPVHFDPESSERGIVTTAKKLPQIQWH